MVDWNGSFEGYSRKELRRAIKRAEPSIFEHILQFLEDDPKTFGSVYAKTLMWQYIRRYGLNERDIHCLELAALKYLERPMRPEYKRMCQTMSFIATPSFWQEIEKQLVSENPVMQLNAYCLRQYSEGLNAGERKRLEAKTIKRVIKKHYWKNNRQRYGPYFWGKHVWEAVSNPSVWKDKQVVYREPIDADLPILRNDNDYQLTILDFSYCEPDKVIDALNPILIGAKYQNGISAWVSIFYVFGELSSNQALPIIENFYTTRIAHQFESAKRWLTTQAIRRSLQRIGTPEALQAVAKYQHIGSATDAHMKSFTTGWLADGNMPKNEPHAEE